MSDRLVKEAGAVKRLARAKLRQFDRLNDVYRATVLRRYRRCFWAWPWGHTSWRSGPCAVCGHGNTELVSCTRCGGHGHLLPHCTRPAS